MITYKTGNILDANAEVLVNTVNTVGVMGKGIALQFKKHFPENNRAYAKAVEKGELKVGTVQVVPVSSTSGTRYVINFPTKAHWRYPSRLDWIIDGLSDLRQKLQTLQVKSIAIPPLGCGNGGLDWDQVRLEIEKAMTDLPLEVQLYQPSEQVKRVLMKEHNPKAAKLTSARAMILHLLYRYRALGEAASEFAAEKLAYFLQRFGEKQLKLDFQQGYYGPYSGKMRHVLYALNGYYISGFEQKQVKPFEELQLKTDKAPELQAYMQENLSVDEKERLETVSKLIRGYESPYGLELLATVDFLIRAENIFDEHKIHQRLWSERKSQMFTEGHIKKAVKHLKGFELYS